MFDGQGSPNRDSRYRRASSANAWAMLWTMVLLLFVSFSSVSRACKLEFGTRTETGAAEIPKTTHKMRLRVTWGGGVEKPWRIVLKTKDATISHPRLLGLAADAPGVISTGDNEWAIASNSPNNYGGIDFDIEGYSNSHISIEVFEDGTLLQTFFHTAQLEDLKVDPLNEPLDDQQNRLVVSRIPGDTFDVDINRPHVLFDPSEAWNLKIRPRLTAFEANQKMRLHVRVTRARESSVILDHVWQDVIFDQWGNADTSDIALNVPNTEGVYDLNITLESPWYQAKLSSDRASRKIQFVVIDGDVKPASTSRDSWTLVSTLQPSNELDQAAGADTWSMLPSTFKTLLPSKPSSKSELVLAPGDWKAIPLDVSETGRPYRVRVKLESNGSAGFSILQPNESGHISNFGFNSGLAFTTERSWLIEESELSHSHEFQFWATTRQPFLIVTNNSNTESMTLGDVVVEQGPSRLESALPSQATRDTRSHLAFFELPLFAENFAGEKYYDRGSGQTLDDWETFYSSAERLIQHLKSSGYTGTMLTVNAQGGTIYPSERLLTSPRFDSGVFFSTGQDVVQKDVLEMLCRMFDREELTLVPTLCLADPLPELEQRASMEKEGDDLFLADYRGQRATPNGTMPRYHAISTSVRDAVNNAIAELSQRYAGHESFQGVSLVSRGDTCVLLPGRKWGYDRATVQRFYAEGLPGITRPNPEDSHEQLIRSVLGQHFAQWSKWRCQKIAENIATWERTLKSHSPNAKLYLASIDPFRIGDVHHSMTPSLHETVNLEESLHDIGWDFAEIQRTSSAVILRPHRQAPFESIAAQRVDVHSEQSPYWESTAVDASFGDLFYRRDSWVHFQDLPNRLTNYQGPQEAYRFQSSAPRGIFARQHLAEALYRFDTPQLVEGGWTLNLGDIRSTREFFAAYLQLPKERFQDTSTSQPVTHSPVRVRQFRSPDGIWFGYAVNRSPWTVNLKVKFAAATQTLERLGNPPTRVSTDENGDLDLEVEPFGLVAFQSNQPQTSINDYSAKIDEQAVDQIRKHVHKLQGRLSLAAKAQPLNVLANVDFSDKEGWILSAADQTVFDWINDASAADNRCLSMQSNEKVAWLRSQWFALPETGRLTVAFWLRIDPQGEQPPLRIAIESDEKDVEYYRFGSVGSLAHSETANPLEPTWKQFVVHFDDLPINPTARLRVGLDLMGAGKVCVDRVELMDRWFDENDLKAITQTLASASSLLADSHSADGARIAIDGYWPRFVDSMFDGTKSQIRMSANEASFEKNPNFNAENRNQGSDAEPMLESNSAREGFMFRRMRRTPKW